MMEALFVIYGLVAVVILATGVATYFLARNEYDARSSARAVLAAFIWPVIVVVAAPYVIKRIIRDADLKNIWQSRTNFR